MPGLGYYRRGGIGRHWERRGGGGGGGQRVWERRVYRGNKRAVQQALVSSSKYLSRKSRFLELQM